MSTPTFYWHPDPGSISATLEATDLGEEVSDLQETPTWSRVGERALSGRYGCTVVGASLYQVRIVLERFTTESVRRKLEGLQNHLDRGGYCGFVLDTGDAWAGFLTRKPVRGTTVLYTTGNVWWGSGTLSNGDELVIEGLGPQGLRERVTVASSSGSTITLDSPGCAFTYEDEAISIRHRDYWPILHREAGENGAIVSSTRRISYTLDVTLLTDPAVLAILASSASSPLIGTTAGMNRYTLQELLAREPSSMSWSAPGPQVAGLAAPKGW